MDDLDGTRANPDSPLKAIEKEGEATRRGHLKIFFGYAAGSGKTYAMLRAAHAAKRRGIDVVAGNIEPHTRPATAALVRSLEVIPPKRVEMAGATMLEFDLDAALERAPQLILVDELAHTDAPGCRHKKRYQDVKELLHAGIDVFTTVNVQHIESLNDMVASITGVIVRERIPDSVFDEADQVELVDIEPSDLIERLKGGKANASTQAGRTLSNFFTVENLTALREIALRRCADRMNLLSDKALAKSNRDYRTGEHVLVCVSPSASNPTILRTAARMATAFKAEFTALYVKTPDTSSLSDEDDRQLHANLELAEQLGAHVVSAYGDDVAFQLAEFARLSVVSKLVMGRNTARRSPLGRSELTDRLIELAPSLDIYIIPDKVPKGGRRGGRRGRGIAQPTRWFTVPQPRDLLWAAGLLAGATAIGFAFDALGFTTENITSAYILATLICAIMTAHRPLTMVVALVSVVLFNYCFVDPRFTFAFVPAYGPTFVVMFVTALLCSTLANHINDQARQAALTAYRTKMLFDTEQLLGQAADEAQVFHVVAEQLSKLLERDVVVYPSSAASRARAEGTPEAAESAEAEAKRILTSRRPGATKLARPYVVSAQDGPDGGAASPEVLSPNEASVAAWVFKNNKHAGATTTTLPDAHCLYLAIRAKDEVFGVIGIVMGTQPLDAFENSTVLSILGECALVLEGKRAAREREEATLLAKNEKLRANLLRSIGHDLRTPLTSISGSASLLLSDSSRIEPEKRTELLTDISENAHWLTNLVENLLAVTRVQEGTLDLKLTPELVDEVVGEAVGHLSHVARADHDIEVRSGDGVLMAKLDARLIMQVVVNLVDNAVKYAPKGTLIDVSVRRDGQRVVCEVADAGPGIPGAEKAHVFEEFYTVRGISPVDGRRSLGLGLSLCKSIVEAHGGRIWARDNKPQGSVFGFSLPAYDPPGL